MKNIFKVWFYMVLLAAVMVSANSAWAQEKKADMQVVIEKLQADKKLLMADTMELTETEAKVFWPVYDNYQKQLKNLFDRLIKVVEKYAENYKTISDEDLKGLLDEYLAIERENLTLMESYLPKFRKILSEKKVFLYYQLENKIEAGMNTFLAEQIPLLK